ncbi:MAG: hypothetical protein HWD59_14465 [Coxiellaceae bacterium]|nr:MAG: hypothetical protein HWD59_14465 [Coxiellaceae bacterium]
MLKTNPSRSKKNQTSGENTESFLHDVTATLTCISQVKSSLPKRLPVQQSRGYHQITTAPDEEQAFAAKPSC